MTYPGLFQGYELKGRGKGWIKTVQPEDRAVFVNIGLQESGHGQLGGRAVYTKRGRDYMASIGRIGAIKTNSIKAWNKALREELERELGVTFDY
jgi:hypothetical protein